MSTFTSANTPGAPVSSQSLDILTVFKKRGYTRAKTLAASLQGSVWSVNSPEGESLVVKVASKELHEQSLASINGVRYSVEEDIKKEAQIMRYLTADKNPKNLSQGIVKFVDLMQSKQNYYLVMENGGSCLFEFVVKAHRLIATGKLDIAEWQKCVKVIYKQLLDAMHYMHSRGIVHYDISLENMVINEVAVMVDDVTGKIEFMTEEISVKLIDFGVADVCSSVDKNGVVDSRSTKFVGKEIYKSPEVQRKKYAFDAMSNDVFCSGVCLYSMVFGSAPWKRASLCDERFAAMMQYGLLPLIDQSLDQLHLVTVEILNLLSRIFQYEDQRIKLGKLLKHEWIRN